MDAIVPVTPAAVSLDQHPAAVYLAGLGQKSRQTMRTVLNTCAAMLTGGRQDAGTLDWTQVGHQHIAALREALAARYAPATANLYLSAVRSVLREAWRLGLITRDALERARDAKGVKGSRLPKGRALNRGERRDVFAAAQDRTPALAARDRALLAVLYGCGLRRSELVSLDVASIDVAAATVRVIGKGNKERELPVSAAVLAAVQGWLQVRGGEPGPLLLRVRRGGHPKPGRLTSGAVLKILRTLAAEAGVAQFSPHDMRRTFISELLERGADLVKVQKLAGHASPTTTARYDRRDQASLRAAVELLDVPV